MPVLYTLIVNNPNFDSVDVFPPSVLNSTWLSKLNLAVQSVGFIVSSGVVGTGNQFIIFDSETDLNNFLNSNRLTDPTLVSDVNAWKQAHSIEYNSKAYSLDGSPISFNPLF
jgi:hypothetical protein